MKTYFFILILLMFTSCAALKKDLVIHFPFNENTNDLSTNKLNGIAHNVILTTDRKNKSNAAYYFNGTNSYISVPHNNLLNLNGDFSISLWVEVSSEQVPHEGINDILRKWNGNAEGYPLSISYLNPVAKEEQQNKILWARYDGQICGNSQWELTSTIKTNTFLHYVVIKKGKTINQYINNTLVAETEESEEFCSTNNTADLTIGCRGNLVRFFKGKIDDIRIYSRAITASEIKKLYLE